MHNYEGTYQVFPRAFNMTAPDSMSPPGTLASTAASSFTVILPFLDQTALYQRD